MNNLLNLSSLEERMNGVLDSFKHDLSGLRTGRASVNLLDPIMVDSYGSKVPLNQVANISVPEPRLLSVSVWDKSMVVAVEKAIRESSLGLNPIVDGTLLRLPLPELNEQRRKELVKIAGQYAENSRVAIRHVRRDGIDHFKKLEKDSTLSKDDVHIACEKIQKLTDDMIDKVDNLLAVKEKEIMQI
ncbi:ribosome recycling factor [Bartonella sp. DGB1]|uniref:ribosome recycling factor n=1 Tax=Bartonella sp. DGB1 TaxID=3239807 RepID=UPI003524ED6C